VNEHDRPLLEIEIQNCVARATQNQINCRSSPPFRWQSRGFSRSNQPVVDEGSTASFGGPPLSTASHPSSKKLFIFGGRASTSFSKDHIRAMRQSRRKRSGCQEVLSCWERRRPRLPAAIPSVYWNTSIVWDPLSFSPWL